MYSNTNIKSQKKQKNLDEQMLFQQKNAIHRKNCRQKTLEKINLQKTASIFFCFFCLYYCTFHQSLKKKEILELMFFLIKKVNNIEL